MSLQTAILSCMCGMDGWMDGVIPKAALFMSFTNTIETQVIETKTIMDLYTVDVGQLSLA